MHLAGVRELEDVRYDLTLARVRGPMAQRLAELSITEGAAFETQRKAAEEVNRMVRARDRRARAGARPQEAATGAEKPAPRREQAPDQAASPPPTPPPPEVPEATEAAEAAEAAAVAPAAAEQTSASVDDPRARDDARATARPKPSIERDARPTGERRADERRAHERRADERRAHERRAGERDRAANRPVGPTLAQAAGDRTAWAGPSAHERGRDSGWKKPRAAAFDGPAHNGGADARRHVISGARRGRRVGPGQQSRPPPIPTRRSRTKKPLQNRQDAEIAKASSIAKARNLEKRQDTSD